MRFILFDWVIFCFFFSLVTWCFYLHQVRVQLPLQDLGAGFVQDFIIIKSTRVWGYLTYFMRMTLGCFRGSLRHPKELLNYLGSLDMLSYMRSIVEGMINFLRSYYMVDFSSVQFSRSVVSDSFRPHESQHARPLSITNSRSSLRLTPIESVMPSHPRSSPSPPAPNPSQYQSLFQ